MSDIMKTKVAVIGAGHAGIEAALASARMGVDTVLFTMSLDAIANMPCNPSIGGTAKGHLVYEIDALGGEMGYAADQVTLQSRTLNLGKGAAVQSKRIQADRKQYQAVMKQTLETTPHLRLVQAEIVELLTADGASASPMDICSAACKWTDTVSGSANAERISPPSAPSVCPAFGSTTPAEPVTPESSITEPATPAPAMHAPSVTERAVPEFGSLEFTIPESTEPALVAPEPIIFGTATSEFSTSDSTGAAPATPELIVSAPTELAPAKSEPEVFHSAPPEPIASDVAAPDSGAIKSMAVGINNVTPAIFASAAFASGSSGSCPSAANFAEPLQPKADALSAVDIFSNGKSEPTVIAPNDTDLQDASSPPACVPCTATETTIFSSPLNDDSAHFSGEKSHENSVSRDTYLTISSHYWKNTNQLQQNSLKSDKEEGDTNGNATFSPCQNSNACSAEENHMCLATPRHVCGVVTRLGEIWNCECVIVATGTYLDSTVFVGDVNYAAGPDGMLPAQGLSSSLRQTGIRLLRFKTGTPARVKRSSIDFSVLEEQPGEPDALPFSTRTHSENTANDASQFSCHIVYTNAQTHRIIRENITRSALYSGKIHGTGPRYCPSIEDKLVRFADKPRHQLFVEPMGRNTEEMYIQGFSTSLPTDVQRRMLQSLPGFERAEMMRYAYAIEYDCADPTQMDASLEFKDVRGLFGAGQFNGTSGYEEAAAQGLVAGINAARRCLGKTPMVLSRSSGYIGTLIDDLVTKGTNEPYRMMTSRSEYRLLLRQDNADLRLTPIGYEVGLISEARYQTFLAKKHRQQTEKQRLERTTISPAVANPFLLSHGEPEVKSGVTLADLLRRPGLSYHDLAEIDFTRPALTPAECLTVESDIKYAGYAARQLADVARQRKLEEKQLPENLQYSQIKGLRIEAAQKLERIRPRTLGQASRISGVNPADISVLMIYLGIH